MTAPAPKHLSAAAAAWFREVCAQHTLQPQDIETLTIAATQLDRMATAREAIKKHGVVVIDDKGIPRQNPAITMERNSGLVFIRAVRAMKLDVGADYNPHHDAAYDWAGARARAKTGNGG